MSTSSIPTTPDRAREDPDAGAPSQNAQQDAGSSTEAPSSVPMNYNGSWSLGPPPIHIHEDSVHEPSHLGPFPHENVVGHLIPLPKDSREYAAAVVRSFLAAPSHFFSKDGNTVTLTEAYAVNKIGEDQFIYARGNSGRRILRADSAVWRFGLDEGLPKAVLDWLADPQADDLVLPVEEFQITKRETSGFDVERSMGLE